ncbi:MAG: hypothetical protein R3C44_11810 [Chloroflexota bacterium]
MEAAEPTPEGGRWSTKMLKILKVVFKNTKQLTEEQEEYIAKNNHTTRRGSLPKQTTKVTMQALNSCKSEMINPLKVLAVLIEDTVWLAGSHYASDNPQSAGKREVILSLYLAGE